MILIKNSNILWIHHLDDDATFRALNEFYPAKLYDCLDCSCCNIRVESKDLTHLETLQLRILVFIPSSNYLIASYMYNVLVNSSNTTMIVIHNNVKQASPGIMKCSGYKYQLY